MAATNIQAAVQQVEDGSTVWIDDGVYRHTAELTLDKPITLRGVNPAPAVVIDGGNTVRGIHIAHGGATVRDVAVRHGLTTGMSPDGAGIYAPNGGMIYGAIIQSNQSYRHGGGIYAGPGVQVSNCVVSGNHGAWGGGGI